MKHRAAVVLFAMIASTQAFPARAAVLHGHVWEATYLAAYQPTFGPQKAPYAGTMKLKFNNGIVSGTYVSESIRPDPLYGKTVAVTGNVSEGQITLTFQTFGGFTVRGTLASDGEISGTATIKGSFYSFLAKVKSSP
jgi:hypothetical protein